MSYRMALKTVQLMWPVLLLLVLVGSPVAAADSQATVAGLPAEEALRLGEAMYLKGVLPSGKPMKAMVQGDIELTGGMSTCSNCHRRSGLGSVEGGVLTPPTNGAKLYAPLLGQQDIPGSVMKRSMYSNPPRPAYTGESLANALRYGTGPTGRKLNETMPRYLLDEEATQIMAFYLKNLSSEISPGVTKEEIRFATILTEDVSSADRDAMVLPLTAYLRDEWNARLSVLGSQWNARWYGSTKAGEKTYRKASLDVWELKGPPGTWSHQLQAFYEAKPVFAVLGGIAPGKWTPIHEFCEKNKIPCIFPVTDLPVVSDGDWYTVYFSKGLYQEGETAAKYLSRVFDLPADKQVVQVFRDNERATALAQGFADTWKKLGNASLANRVVSAAEKTGGVFWKDLAATYPNAVMLVWLGPADLAGMEALTKSGDKPPTLFVSATMLGGELTTLPEKIREFTFITYPARLPQDQEYTRSIVTNWMKSKKIPITNLNISAKAYFATRVLSKALLDMGVDFYRDFFLDMLDDGIDQPNSSLTYPMLTFGPGQRYASKGCYVVSLTKGDNPKVVRQSDWVLY